jgi:hypothetical protein
MPSDYLIVRYCQGPPSGAFPLPCPSLLISLPTTLTIPGASFPSIRAIRHLDVVLFCNSLGGVQLRSPLPRLDIVRVQLFSRYCKRFRNNAEPPYPAGRFSYDSE